MQKHGTSFEKLQVLAKSMTFLAFSRNETIFATFCLKVHANARNCFLLQCSSKCQNMVVCSKGWEFWPNRWVFVLFHDMRHFLQLFSEKFIEMQRHGSLFQKLQSFDQILIFRAFSRNEALFATFSWKVHRNAKIWYFVRKVAKFWPNRWFFQQTTMFWCFDELFSKRLQKVAQFVKKQKKSSISPKLCNFFEQTTMFWCFDEPFSKRLQKVAQYVRKHEKSSIWPKLCNFSNKLPCLCISINFSGKSCKKCLIL